jgi:hypothetical protein
MAQIEYQRLTRPRTRARFAAVRTSNGSLWLGTDHLLSVDSNGYTESYKRFYFRDIQSITIQKTGNWQIWNFIWGIAVFIALALVLATKPPGWPSSWDSNDEAGLFFFTGLIALLVMFLLINFFLGATCKCYLRTAVQIEELPSLRRLRKTRKIMAQIRPLIAAAQGGELSPQTIAELVRQPEAQPAAGQAVSSTDESNIPSTPQ